MSLKQAAKNKKNFPFLALAAAGVLVILMALGLGFAGSQEDDNAFCASCHTQPEVDYVQRMAAPHPADLASVHPKIAGCIGCHSGKGTFGRVQAEFIGARNALKWYLGIAVQPAVLTFPIHDENCLECHQLLIQAGFSPQEQIAIPLGSNAGLGAGKDNHWHTDLARWQAASASAGGCVSCHSGHTTNSTPQNGFMNPQQVLTVCNACHLALNVQVK